MKIAAYVTTNKNNANPNNLHEVLQYCKEHDIDLKVMLQVTPETVLFHPEQIVKDVQTRNCEMILTDDRFLLLSESIGLENTLLRESQNNELDYMFTEEDMEMKELSARFKIDRTQELCRKDNNIGAVLIYQRTNHDKENIEIQEMQELIKLYLNEGEAYGVMFYESEEADMFQSLNQLIVSNPIHLIVMKDQFQSIEGKQFIKTAKQLEITCSYYEFPIQTHGQKLS